MRSSGKADHRGQPPGCKERRRMDSVGGSKSNQHREVYLHSCMRAGTRSNVFLAVSPTSEIVLAIVSTQHISVQ